MMTLDECAREARAVTSELTHKHECWKCGYMWSHQNDDCDVQPKNIYNSLAICPDCDE